MKKFFSKAGTALVAATVSFGSLCAVQPAAAATPQAKCLLISAGSVSNQPAGRYQVVGLDGLDVVGVQSQGTGTNTFTLLVKRVATLPINDNATNTVTLTNTLGTVTTAAGATSASLTFTNAYFYQSDQLIISGAGTNAGYALPKRQLYEAP